MPKYSVNEDYFNDIDSHEKAYWLGFIWCDSYVCHRRNTYEFKLGLSEVDKGHLEKLKTSISSTHEVKTYNVSTGHKEARLYISNKRFAGTLFEKHKIQPHRPDNEHIKNFVSEMIDDNYGLISHFMRGVLDAEGSIKIANKTYGSVKRNEFSVSISTHPVIVELFNNALIFHNLVDTIYTKVPDSSSCTTMQITGNNKAEKVLDWLYADCGGSMLDRKHEKYLFVKNYMENYRIEKGEM